LTDVAFATTCAFVDSFNVFRDIPEVEIGSYCTIGSWNRFETAQEFANDAGVKDRGNQPRLIVGAHCGIGGRHFFDVQDELTIGSYSTIAGCNSVFFTHQLDIGRPQQSAKPVHIGEYCIIGSRVAFAPGAHVASKCIVGMGSMVAKRFEEPYSLIVGNPARVVKQLPPEAMYFHREHGYISSYTPAPFELPGAE